MMDSSGTVEDDLQRSCTRCALANTRTQVVLGRGNPRAQVFFLGEAPGREEDIQGEGFRGAAGKQFDAILDFIGISRDDIWLANTVRCRPSIDGRRNRPPDKEEIQACSHWLQYDLIQVRPTIIVTLGRMAFEAVSGLPWTTNRHGQSMDVPQWNAMLYALYHPAYLIYRRNLRRDYYHDLVALRQLLTTRHIPLADPEGPWVEEHDEN